VFWVARTKETERQVERDGVGRREREREVRGFKSGREREV
jgi:hypothetical protein